jgi:hypothetical protein
MKRLSERHWGFLASLAVLSVIAMVFIVLNKRPKVLSMEHALSIAKARVDINEARRNPDKKKWDTPVLVSQRLDPYDSAWHFDFASAGCEYWIAVDADGSTDITGMLGCEVSGPNAHLK